MTLTPKQLRHLRAQSAPSGNRVGIARRLKGLTLSQLSDLTGLSPTYIGDVERGRHQTISVANAEPFVAVFGCSIEDLFCPDGVKVRAA